ncbi:NACHT C-terminal helical domain 2-containing protein [Crocosphaera sp. XPORK-15E]|uniref:NACHT C-terminal helical domain 2-containing protein n=1 Tax=Crocosphaera sp. XPORK-15E TaxID=3110247 RepID=UPI002B21B395|nr:hypothetical protein [Crocosphaera sp. XPORK-15E]MEA5535830.1 hypothetical protein [Crocosphaera sp. XPORK-15E]
MYSCFYYTLFECLTAYPKKFINKLSQTWNNAFHLTPELVNLRIEELEEIDNNYFYINLLMVNCQKAAVNVSPKTWEGIEDRMLRANRY